MGSLVCGLATSSVVAPHLAPSSHPALWALVVVRPFSLHRLRSPLSDPVLFSSDRQLLPPTVIGHHLFGVVRIHHLPDPVALRRWSPDPAPSPQDPFGAWLPRAPVLSNRWRLLLPLCRLRGLGRTCLHRAHVSLRWRPRARPSPALVAPAISTIAHSMAATVLASLVRAPVSTMGGADLVPPPSSA
jgi:hypothetical protein